MTELLDLLPIILIAFVLWLIALSAVFYRLLSHYKRIAKKGKDGDLIAAIETLLKTEEANSAEVKKLKGEVAAVTARQGIPIQKVGLVRFNPFNETGGDQSFSLCLLNGLEDGFILTALHTRDRTRVYTKPVTAGESKYELSKEENRALKEAKTEK